MPLAAAVLGSAVVGAGASVYGASKASKAASNAAKENARVQEGQYQQTRQDLAPYTQGGYAALDDLLGQFTGPQPGTPDYQDYLANNPDVAKWAQGEIAQGTYRTPEEAAAAHYRLSGQSEGRELGTIASPTAQWDTRPQAAPRPTYGDAPSFASFMDNTPSQQYRDELTDVTRSTNARAGATGGYFSGGRALALQDNADKLFNADYDRRWNRANTLYQSALNQYNQTRNFTDDNYDVDQLRGDARFDADRAYGTGRIDNRTNNLFNLLGVGANATSSLVGAGQNNANNQTANNNALASVRGNAAIAGANGVNNILGQGLSAYGYFKGGGNIYGGGVPKAQALQGASYAYPYGMG